MAITGQSHQPGVWKQQNKSHKTGRHRSKGQINVQHKGRVDVKTTSKQHKKVLQKVNRRHRSQQIRSQKREEVVNRKRSIGVGHNPPHLTVLVPLHQTVDVTRLSDFIQDCASSDGSVVSTAPLATAGFTVNIPRLRHRFQIIQPGSATYENVLDCVQVADTVVLVVACDENEPIDQQGHSILSCLLAQGMPAMVFVTQGLKELSAKMRHPVKKDIVKCLERYVAEVKFHVVDSEQDAFNMLRTVAELKRRTLGMRERRAYMLVEKVSHECDESKETGTLMVTGHIRGSSLDVNRLVHLAGWGNYQISHIDQIAEHCPWNVQKNKNPGEESMEEKKVIINGKSYHPWENICVCVKCDPEQQQDLISEAVVDPMDGEQTWPTNEELAEAEDIHGIVAESKTKVVKKVPKGTSDYQAAWILDNDEDWREGSEKASEDDESDVDMDDDLHPREEEASQVGDEIESVMMSEVDDTESQYDEKARDDPEDVVRFREERSHQMFPDEIDTPTDTSARVRFQKFRGLQSFRTSPWDPKENLPLDYGRIFQFQSFDRTRNRIRTSHVDEESSVKPGTYVTLHLMNVPKAYVDQHSPNSPLTLFGLFPHEQKMSVLHFALKQFNDSTIKSKDELLFHVGFRKFRARPIFSQHTLGNKHKMERFFPKEGVIIATVFAPITFPPANVIAFSESKGESEPVATGTLYKVDPDRIITKRVVLSGHPYRINKRAAVIRYMFFNREDVQWFKPVELRTKWGRRGHIKEPLGTHGHMKCMFNSQLVSQDTVLMCLHKRVFPKWSYEPLTPLCKAGTSIVGSDKIQGNESTFDEEFFME
ncbi:pre-rRNA-processing protein TSR1 homolog [Clavelina lepadiformis]|uniref:pre-rRNA-processing protein TSR1 homolog n=1 Tax=Clavelina lepadiformis TaxID=159417 RepID=UPI0040424436